MSKEDLSEIGLFGLATMGQNLALNIASKGIKISVCNRSPSKVDETCARAKEENCPTLKGYYQNDKADKGKMKEFVESIRKPRNIIILVQAGPAVDQVIEQLMEVLEPNDMIIDGGNEWYENTEKRELHVQSKNLLYMGMGVSGGEEGARHGPSLMPGGSHEGYKRIEHILKAIAAKSKDGTICVTHIGSGGSGNYVKMVHNGIEYGDMQLIAEAYDLLKNIAGLSNEKLSHVFNKWNQGLLESYLIEITSQIFLKKDDRGPDHHIDLIDVVLDKTGQKGTGQWTVQEAANKGVAAPTITAALNMRFLSSLKDERVNASKFYKLTKINKLKNQQEIDQFINDLEKALYCSKICSYTQGMNLIRIVGINKKWNLNLGKIASIWKAGCIIRAKFLDRITLAYDKNPHLVSLLMDESFSKEIMDGEESWRRIISHGIMNGIPCPALSASLEYFDTYKRENLPANLTQAQRDFFGAHTYQRKDNIVGQEFVHSEWNIKDSKYNNNLHSNNNNNKHNNK